MPAGDPYVLWLEDCDASRAPAVGGKCAGLGEMIKAGVSVPAGFAVTTSAHGAFLDERGLDERISSLLAGVDLDDVHSVDRTSEAVREAIESSEVPPLVERAVRDAYRELCARTGRDSVPVAVRSSAVSEDLAGASFAGQLETFLWVQGADEVVRHTLRAWAGLFTPSALTYRGRLGFSNEHALMSVGVQQMVEPRAAGVLFTLNPLNGDRSKIMVESSFGLGESVVGGEVDPDRWLVDKVTLEVVERTIATKSLEYRFDPEQGAVAAAPVPDERAREPSLTDPEVLELAKVGKRIERHHGTPRDIEWALVDGLGEASIQILQSRPETVWSQRQPDDPILGRKGSAVEYVLAELMDLGGVKPSQDPGAER